MSYATLRNSVREILKGIETTEGFSGHVHVEEHPWDDWDMMTVSVNVDGRVVGAFILNVNPGNIPEPTFEIDRVDLRSLSRPTIAEFTLNEEWRPDPEMVSRTLSTLFAKCLGPSAAEVAHQKEAKDLSLRMKATRPRVASSVLPAADGKFDLLVHGLMWSEVLRAIEALPEAKPEPLARTAFEHLLDDEL